MTDNPLNKYNKLKRFSAFVAESIGKTVSKEVEKVDCLFNGDIYTRRDMYEKLDKIADCASLVELRKYEDGKTIVHNANYCHNPIVCPVCADRVSKRRRALFSDPLKKAIRKFAIDDTCTDWKKEYPAGYTGVYLATATIKDGDNLKDRIDVLLESIKRMRKKGQRRTKKRSLGEWSKVRAGISNVEIKIGSGSERWHVHAHFLLFTDSPLNFSLVDSPYYYTDKNGNKKTISKWNYEWFESTKGEGVNFDLKPVQFRKFVAGRNCETFQESILAQAQEILKYPALLTAKKGLGVLSASQYVELIQRRGNRRLFNPIGLMRCDKRNPESFMTISERELSRLEYIESLDKKCYEIMSSKWQKGGVYTLPVKQDAAVFSSSDDINTKWVNARRVAFLAQTAKYQGEYRKKRGALFKTRNHHINSEAFENLLNECRDFFRSRVKNLWEKYSDIYFLPEFLTDFCSGGLKEFHEKLVQFA